MKLVKYLTMAALFSSIFSIAAHVKQYNANNNLSEFDNYNSGAIHISPLNPVSKLFLEVLKLNEARIGNSEQIILVYNRYIEDINVKIQTFEKINGEWDEKFASTTGTTGKNGFAPYKEKHEGDGKAPTGIFFLGPVFSVKGENVSTKMNYWEASENDYWIDDTLSKQYNRWVTSNSNPHNNVSCEDMLRTQDTKYKYGIAIQYNMDQIQGKGSVIVVHVLEGNKYTLGCIAVPEDELLEIIGWLDPEKKPLIIMGSEEELLSTPISASELDANDKYIWKKEKFIPPTK